MKRGATSEQSAGTDRADVLLAGYLDGVLTEREQSELHGLLKDRPELLDELLALRGLDGLLRNLPSFRGVPAAEQTEIMMRKLGARLNADSGLFDVIVERLETEPAVRHRRVRRPSRPPLQFVPRRRRWAAARWGPALAASALVAVGLLWRFGPEPVNREGLGARLVRGSPDLSVRRHGVLLAGDRPLALRLGDAFQLAASKSDAALVRYSDGTELRVSGPARLMLSGTAGIVRRCAGSRAGAAVRRMLGVGPCRKDVAVSEGILAVSVPHRSPAVQTAFTTPHAELTVVGTRFLLRVSRAATRVDMEEGRVRIRNLHTGEILSVDTGQFARIAVSGSHVASSSRSAGRRVRRPDLQALYTFAEGAGTVVRDVSGAGAPLDLRISNPAAVVWQPDGGLLVKEPVIIASREPALKIIESCRATQELSVEAWVQPLDLSVHGPVRIVELGDSPYRWNFILGMEGRLPPPAYIFRLLGAGDGTRERSPASAVGTVAPRLTHIVCTRARDGRLRLYVDGKDRNERAYVHNDERGEAHIAAGGVPYAPNRSADWSSACRLALANHVGGDRAWLGRYYLVAIYSRAVTADEVVAFFAAGPVVRKDAMTP